LFFGFPGTTLRSAAEGRKAFTPAGVGMMEMYIPDIVKNPASRESLDWRNN
jgi:hypothetical protein